jgi:hypothetical protein
VSGLFSRLAARARGTEVGAVRPLVPSPFEPETSEFTERVEAPGLLPGPAHGPVGSTAGTPLLARRALEPSASLPRAGEQRPLQTSREAEQREAIAGSVAQAGSSERVAEAHESATRVDHAVAVAGPDQPPSVHAGRSRPHSRVAAADSVARNREHAAGEPRGALESREAVDSPAEPRVSDWSDEPLLPAAGRSAARPREVASAVRSSASSEVPPAAPIVRVTIGRIDVRTAAPAPAPRPAVNRHAPLALDDYLRRRDEPGRGSGP